MTCNEILGNYRQWLISQLDGKIRIYVIKSPSSLSEEEEENDDIFWREM